MPTRGGGESEEDYEACIDILHSIMQRYGTSHTIIVGGDLNVDLTVTQNATHRRERAINTLLQEHQLAWKT
jgi:hypothetical protein